MAKSAFSIVQDAFKDAFNVTVTKKDTGTKLSTLLKSGTDYTKLAGYINPSLPANKKLDVNALVLWKQPDSTVQTVVGSVTTALA